MWVIGLAHRIGALTGWHHITMDAITLRATGTEIAAGLSIIIIGTATMPGTPETMSETTAALDTPHSV